MYALCKSLTECDILNLFVEDSTDLESLILPRLRHRNNPAFQEPTTYK